jgi:hypothetical protein
MPTRTSKTRKLYVLLAIDSNSASIVLRGLRLCRLRAAIATAGVENPFCLGSRQLTRHISLVAAMSPTATVV